MESWIWLGVDVSKETFHASVATEQLLGEAWRKLPCKQFDLSASGLRGLLKWLKALSVRPGELDGVCIESTGRLAQRFVKLAKGRLGEIAVINPARSKHFMSSLGFQHKNDRVDACLLAYFGQQRQPRPQRPQTPELTRLREMTRAYANLQSQYQANRLRLEDGPESKEVRALLRRIINSFKREMDKLQERIQKLIDSEPALRDDADRITTVPGLGARVAQTLLAEFGDLRQYNRDQIVALAGLYPRQYESGTSVHKKPRRVQAGKANVRAVLYMAAMSAQQCNPGIKIFAQRLRQYGKAPMQILVAIMRKLLMTAHALIKNGTDYEPKFAGQKTAAKA